jgi:hypothetical protein
MKNTLSHISLYVCVLNHRTLPCTHECVRVCVCVCAQICLETDINFCALNSAILLIIHKHEEAHASSPMHVFNCAHY